MLNKKVEKALNEQVSKEAYASSVYLSMASWAETKGYRGTTEFYYAQSAEEREHMLKLVRYINQSGGHAMIPSIPEPPKTYKSMAHTFEVSLKQEQEVTRSINKLVDLTLQNRDYASNHFLQWYVAEQHEEEGLFNAILDIFRIGGTEGKNLLIVDNEISKIRQREASASG